MGSERKPTVKSNVLVLEARIRGHNGKWMRVGLLRKRPDSRWTTMPFTTPEAFVEMRTRAPRKTEPIHD